MRISAVLVALIFPFCVLSQWSVTPELGTNLIPVKKTDLGNEFRLGWHVGANVQYDFNDVFSLSSGVFASQKQQTYSKEEVDQFTLFGIEEQLDSFGVNRDIITKTEGVVSQFYVEMPLLANYTLNNISFFGGVYVGYSINVRRKEAVNVQTPLMQAFDLSTFGFDPNNPLISSLLPPKDETTFTESSAAEGLRKLDLGFKVGARYTMDQLSFGFAYQRGLLDYEVLTGKEAVEVHHYGQLTIGYRFDF